MYSRLLGPLAGIAVLGLTGCGAATGTFYDPAAETGAILDQAMVNLSEAQILEYEGTVGELTGTGDPATLELTVTDTGTSYGHAESSGYDIEIMIIDGDMYVLAEEGFWTGHGSSEDHAEEVADSWVQVDTSTWVDFSTLLIPDQYVDLVRQALLDSGNFDVALPAPEDYMGTQAYKLPVGDGAVYVEVEAPYAVLAIVNVDIGPMTGASTDLMISTVPSDVDAGAIGELQEAMIAAIETLGTVYGDEASLSLSESGADFQCSNSTFTCDFTVDIEPRTTGDFQKAETASVEMNATADGGALGTEKCSDSATIDIGDSKTLECSVSFDVPADGVEYTISPSWTVTGVAEFEPDVDAIIDAVTTELEALLR